MKPEVSEAGQHATQIRIEKDRFRSFWGSLVVLD